MTRFSRFSRSFLAVLSAYPFAYLPLVSLGGLALGAAAVAMDVGLLPASEAVFGGLAMAFMGGMMLGHAALFAVLFGLTAFYSWHALTNEAWEMNTRLLWTILILVGNVFAFPLYWWMNIREA